MPGLIEGASIGAGLGHAFLRHVGRTRILVHVVDGSARNPERDHAIIRDELAAHDPELLRKPILVVFNKLDLAEARESWPAFRAAREADGLGVVAIAAATGEGIDAFVVAITGLLPSVEELARPPEPAGVVIHRMDSLIDGFAVELEDDGAYRVRGRRIEQTAAQTNFEVEESAERFQRELRRQGIDTELRRQGIQSGDQVRIGPAELEWEPADWDEE